MSYPTFLSSVEGDVRREREAQDAKWGPQNHADGTGPDTVWAFTGPASHVSDTARAECNRLLSEGFVTFRDIALEEVAEAFAEKDPQKLRSELIQCAAVFQAWAEAIDRRKTETTEVRPESLIDPDCRGGKCSSCVGGPCEHECHTTKDV